VYDIRRGNPEFDELAANRRGDGSWLAVLIVLGFGVTVVVGLIALTGVAGLYIVLALAGVLGFAAFHYLLWGWWLTKRIRQEPESEEVE
jgi:hypothetical protein